MREARTQGGIQFVQNESKTQATMRRRKRRLQFGIISMLPRSKGDGQISKRWNLVDASEGRCLLILRSAAAGWRGVLPCSHPEAPPPNAPCGERSGTLRRHDRHITDFSGCLSHDLSRKNLIANCLSEFPGMVDQIRAPRRSAKALASVKENATVISASWRKVPTFSRIGRIKNDEIDRQVARRHCNHGAQSSIEVKSDWN